jgi:hypothetical protein
MGHIQKALEEHQQTLDNLEEEKARSDRLASLATLAAGQPMNFLRPFPPLQLQQGRCFTN